MQQEKDRRDDPRAYADRLAREAVSAGRPLAWFEPFYARALSDGLPITWADREPNPNLIALFNRVMVPSRAKRALIVGCGLGDDAEWMAEQGFDVTAFDISRSAIEECSRRFPASMVTYETVDLFQSPATWDTSFDVVVEVYTLQVLPRTLRSRAIETICRFVSPGGTLLVIARARSEEEPEGSMPWPLVRKETEQFCEYGFAEIYFEDYLDRSGDSAVRRFRACYQRSSI